MVGGWALKNKNIGYGNVASYDLFSRAKKYPTKPKGELDIFSASEYILFNIAESSKCS